MHFLATNSFFQYWLIYFFLQSHLVVLLLVVFEATVYRHQAHHYRQLQQSPSNIPALFPDVTRNTLDEGLLPCFKYLLNYAFYKFGLEVKGMCYLFTCSQLTLTKMFLFKDLFYFARWLPDLWESPSETYFKAFFMYIPIHRKKKTPKLFLF